MEEPEAAGILKKEEIGDGPPHNTEGNLEQASKLQGAPDGLSKNQQKKWLKRQRWIGQKAERRALERRKKKENRQASKALGKPQPPSRKRLKVNTMESSACKVKIAIDCSFDDLMSEKDICHLVQQLNHCYAANRRCPNPVQFSVTGIKEKTLTRLESLGDYKGWDVKFETDEYDTVFGKSNIVYLTSDSPNVLLSLSDDKTYVIGGLVDHNHQKGLCYRLAEEKGIAHAQLPIGEYLELKTRKVLTVNHVFEILVKFTETQSWKEAFFKVIPNRKVSSTTPKENIADVFDQEKVIDQTESDPVVGEDHDNISECSSEPDERLKTAVSDVQENQPDTLMLNREKIKN